jgi:hypothetical protein
MAALGIMKGKAEKWHPIADIESGFSSLTYSFDGASLVVWMHGHRTLRLRFDGVVAVRFEDECPGYEPMPDARPLLKAGVTFPLLRVRGSKWLNDHEAIHSGSAQFLLITSDHLLQVIARPDVPCSWERASEAQQSVQPDRREDAAPG